MDREIRLPGGRLLIPDELVDPPNGDDIFLLEERPDGVFLTFGGDRLDSPDPRANKVAVARVWLSNEGLDRLVRYLEAVQETRAADF